MNIIVKNNKLISVAITGGKGGTGKTLVATNLAVKFALDGFKVLLVDCDVENPNANILLGKNLTDSKVSSSEVNIFLPIFDENICTKCGKCRDVCYRHAILQFPKMYPSLMEPMCSGCEVCQKVCDVGAIKNDERSIGKQYFIPKVLPNFDLLLGELKEGESVSVKIVEHILDYAAELQKTNLYDIMVIDTAPGAHCDVERSLMDADQVICITEPTPFGEHDMKRILELIKIIGTDASFIINRAGITDYKEPIIKMTSKLNVPLIGEIPTDKLVIENYAKGIPFVMDERDFPAKKAFLKIYEKIKKMVGI